MLKTFKTADFGDKLIRDYLDVFSTYSIKNEMYGKISLHVILGQALKNVYYKTGSRKIELRLHLLLIKPQGTGKGAGYGFIKKMAERVGLIFKHVTKSTGPAIAGTMELDPSTKKHVEKDGVLKTADIVGMEEASPLFDLADEFSKMNMTYFQITMNPLEDESCRITRDLVSGTIDYKPHASFILTTYPPDKLVDKLLKTGFLDRTIAIFEEVTLSDRLEVIKQMSRNIGKIDSKTQEYVFSLVANRLYTVIKKYQKDDICITIPDDIKKRLLLVVDELAIKILDASPVAREKLEHFISRLYETLVKLAAHHALLSLRTKLEVSDVLYARTTYLPIWRNLIISIESLLIISPEERARKQAIIKQSINEYDKQVRLKEFVKENIWVRRSTMLEVLQMKWDQCSMETADNNLRKLEKLPELRSSKVARYEKDKFFKRRDIGGVAYLKKIKDLK